MPANSDDEHYIFGYGALPWPGVAPAHEAMASFSAGATPPAPGSIIWRPNMPHLFTVAGFVRGWRRRFWQSSPDHRGLPESPGRVVTLLRHETSTTWGMVFQVDAQHMGRVLAELDHREKAGYKREFVDVSCIDGKRRSALVFTASEANRHYAGWAPVGEIVTVVGAAAAQGRPGHGQLTGRGAQIDRSHGPSGPNDEYLLELAKALSALGIVDPHIAALRSCLSARRLSRGSRAARPRCVPRADVSVPAPTVEAEEGGASLLLYNMWGGVDPRSADGAM